MLTAIALVALGGGGGTAAWVAWLKPSLQKRLRELAASGATDSLAGAKVDIGEAQFALGRESTKLTFSKITVANLGSFASEYLLTSDALVLTIDTGSIVKSRGAKVRVESVVFENMEMMVEGMTSTNNITLLMEKMYPPDFDATAPVAGPEVWVQEFIVKNFTIKVAGTHQLQGGIPAVPVKIEDLVIADFMEKTGDACLKDVLHAFIKECLEKAADHICHGIGQLVEAPELAKQLLTDSVSAVGYISNRGLSKVAKGGQRVVTRVANSGGKYAAKSIQQVSMLAGSGAEMTASGGKAAASAVAGIAQSSGRHATNAVEQVAGIAGSGGQKAVGLAASGVELTASGGKAAVSAVAGIAESSGRHATNAVEQVAGIAGSGGRKVVDVAASGVQLTTSGGKAAAFAAERVAESTGRHAANALGHVSGWVNRHMQKSELS
eukprot:TRINITY_DN9102_c0_g1_i2.p1 TRINITY_DN9102_c0_g1~~TRINITY_DN9102_c0_g1_i2.p1  ORF type:complete len:497 (-),score=86.92 TRINITY_DN9102_c0_g1_i2:175-1485(-)